MSRMLPLGLMALLLATGLVFSQPTALANSAEAEPYVQQIVELTNARRAAAGLPPLKLQPALSNAAAWLAQDLANHSTLSHTDSLGRDLASRINDFGYVGWSSLAENVASGQQTPAEVVDAWMNSSDHRANLLSSSVREIGVGYGFNGSSTFKHYWAQDFGSRFDVHPVVINGEAAATATPTVSLHIYGSGWAQQMRLSNDGITWTPWEAYQPSRDWTLAQGSAGPRTVYVELRNGADIRRAADSITLLIDRSVGTAPTTRASYTFIPLTFRAR